MQHVTPGPPAIEGTQTNGTDFGPTAVVNSCNEQMAVYRSYWRDDPFFLCPAYKKTLAVYEVSPNSLILFCCGFANMP